MLAAASWRKLVPALAAAAFAVFSGNVLAGAGGAGVFLSDIGEMLALFASCILFVVFILEREAAALASARSRRDGPGHDRKNTEEE